MDRARLIELRQKGLSYQQIGRLFNRSRQRIHQIISGYDELNGQLKNGKYKYQHEYILIRDDHKCQKCGAAESLLVHHIDGDDRHNRDGNLITLCSKCHLELHRPKQVFEIGL